MLFTSYSFVFLFLPLFFCVYLLTPARWRSIPLLVGSYVFYGWWRLDFCLLLAGVTLTGYLGGLWIEKGGTNQRLYTSIIVSGLLATLGWFKYAGFLGESWNGMASWLSDIEDLSVVVPEIILPIGISFFTFQTISYLVDVNRGCEACRSPIQFAAFVAMFPQLVAGPIVRYSDIAKEIPAPRVLWKDVDAGLVLFMLGFCKKVWIANNVAPAADWLFTLEAPTLVVSWLGILAYTFQVYFDFSGYSDMAIGLGMMLGFHFPENFRRPYQSKNITEFWQRWHITMSSFFRDYLYVPLGGNRSGQIRTLINLSVTMLLAGLWHGAGWTFLLWGAFHGGLLAIHRVWSANSSFDRLASIRGHTIFAGLLTFFAVVLGWVVFRADSVVNAFAVYGGIFGVNGFDSGSMLKDRFDLVFWMMMLFASIFVLVEGRFQKPILATPMGRVAISVLFLGALHELGGQGYNPFLYFQF